MALPNVFSSGSCRLLVTIADGRGKITPVHALPIEYWMLPVHKFHGKDFIGKQHSTLQHIQFIKFIQGKIHIPDNILGKIFAIHTNLPKFVTERDLEEVQSSIISLRDTISNCDVYIFEICSIKIFCTLYKGEKFYLLDEIKDSTTWYPAKNTDIVHYTESVMTESELLQSLQILYELVPENKKVVFIGHFRPNVIYGDPSRAIDNREIIMKCLCKFQSMRPTNVKVCDPSEYLKLNPRHFDGDTHYTADGHVGFFEYLYNNFIIE
jgi:hypothetical protein